uniref:Uncharacterized protein n=1 Tax=Strongyloides stercoralis TaxID=6248 RepID=A0A0K0EFA5_STRER
MVFLLGESSPTFENNNMDIVERRQFLNKLQNYLQHQYKNMFIPTPYLNKRSKHNIETRSVNEFNNCYFSPIQCVMDKRKK